MNRRKFFKSSAVAGLSLPTIVAASCNNAGAKDAKTTVTNDTPDNFELNEITIDALQQKMQQGAYTSASITAQYLKRIAEIDREGPSLHAVIELNPDAMSIAEALDMERKAGKIRGPLHGIPILLKDNIDTGDQMMTTAGSLALEGNKASKDAFIVGKLREAAKPT